MTQQSPGSRRYLTRFESSFSWVSEAVRDLVRNFRLQEKRWKEIQPCVICVVSACHNNNLCMSTVAALLCQPTKFPVFSPDPSVFCVHLRLHPGITWSHTSDSPCKIPPFSPTEKRVSPEMSGDNRSDGNNINVEGCFGGCEDAKSKLSSRVTAQRGQRDRPGSESPRRLSCAIAADLDLLTFSRDEGSGEWNYPWDLTGGLYR